MIITRDREQFLEHSKETGFDFGEDVRAQEEDRLFRRVRRQYQCRLLFGHIGEVPLQTVELVQHVVVEVRAHFEVEVGESPVITVDIRHDGIRVQASLLC